MKYLETKVLEDTQIDQKIKKYGVSNLAKELSVSESLIYFWLQGRRKVSMARYKKIKGILKKSL